MVVHTCNPRFQESEAEGSWQCCKSREDFLFPILSHATSIVSYDSLICEIRRCLDFYESKILKHLNVSLSRHQL